jgi:hypothetical protein
MYIGGIYSNLLDRQLLCGDRKSVHVVWTDWGSGGVTGGTGDGIDSKRSGGVTGGTGDGIDSKRDRKSTRLNSSHVD